MIFDIGATGGDEEVAERGGGDDGGVDVERMRCRCTSPRNTLPMCCDIVSKLESVVEEVVVAVCRRHSHTFLWTRSVTVGILRNTRVAFNARAFGAVQHALSLGHHLSCQLLVMSS